MTRNQSVQKAVAILRAAGAQPEGTTASALARAARLPNPTALRLIHTLEDEGFLMRMGDGRYVLGLDLLRLQRGAGRAELLLTAARQEFEELAAETRETVTLSIPRGREELEIVLQVDGPHLLGAANWVGGRYPLHATSGGKVLLASWSDDRLNDFLAEPLDPYTPHTITDPEALRREIARVRARGFSVMVNELEDGLAAIGAPILDLADPSASENEQRLVGVVNVSGPEFRFDARARESAVVAVLRVAERLARELSAATRPARV